MLSKLLKNSSRDVIDTVIHDYVGCDTVTSNIVSSVIESASFDILDAFYDNGFKLMDLLEPSGVGYILKSILNPMCMNGRLFNYALPTKEQIDKLYSNNCDSIAEALYICEYLAIKKIIKNENGDCRALRRIVNFLLVHRKTGEVLDDLMIDVAERMDFSTKSEEMVAWISYLFSFGGTRLIEYAKERILNYDSAKKIWDKLEKSKKAEDKKIQEIQNENRDGGELIAPLNNFDADEYEFLDEDDELFDEEAAEEEAPAHAEF